MGSTHSNIENNPLFIEEFYSAVENGNCVKVDTCIRFGYDVNSFGRSRYTPLQVAAFHGRHEMIELLIRNGARVDDIASGSTLCQYTPLYIACSQNFTKSVKVLLEHGASISLQSSDFSQPIHVAVYNNNVKIVRLLLNNGANPNLRFNNQFFDTKRNETTDWYDNMELTLLHFSIVRKYKDLTKVILEYGADVFLKTQTNKTSLMFAVEANDVELVKLLLERGQDVNDFDTSNKAVLFYVVLNSLTDQVVYVKEELDSKDKKLIILKLLYDAGVDVNVNFPPINPYHSIIKYAIIHGQREVVNFILFETNFNYENIDYRIFEICEFQFSLININTQDDIELIRHITDEFVKMKRILVDYIVSKHMISLPIRIEVLSAALSVSFPDDESKNYQTIVYIINDIENIINKMKKTLVENTTISYWRLLMCDMPELIILSGNEDIQALRQSDYKNKFYYIYYQTIRARLDIAIPQNLLFEEIIDVVSSLFGYHLPYDCCRRIVEFFSNEELQEFKNLQT